ncbi:MAG: PilN domain-containing protein [Candidatus Omnitrophota bacterium]
MVGINVKKFADMVNKEMIGIDFTGDNLKFVHAVISLNKVEIAGIATRNISGLIAEDIANVVRGSATEFKVKNPGVISVIPSHSVITKNIEVPSVDPREIKEIINLQAGRHTPYSRDEIIADYIEIGTYKNSYTKILLVIIARSLVKKHLEILDKAGLRLERVLLAAEGLAVFTGKMLKIENGDPPVNIVHLDENHSDFVIAYKNKPIFVRSIPIGTQHILAEKQKYEVKFVEELLHSLEAYQNEDIEKIPNMLILTGAIEPVRELEDTLNNSMHLPVKVLPYIKSIPIAAEAGRAASLAKQMSFMHIIAALFSWDKLKVDLVPEEIKLRKTLEERGKELIKTGIFILMNFILIFFIMVTGIYFKGLYLKRVTDRYQILNEEAKKLESDFDRISRIKAYLAARGYSLEVLVELYNLVSDELQLSDVKFDDQGKVSLRGASESMSAVFTFVEELEKSKYFKEVKTKYTTKRREGTKDVTDFEITGFQEGRKI